MIIGLSGFARSGKDEAAKVLVEKYGYRRIAFADKLREVLYELNPVVTPIGYNNINELIGSYVVHLQDVIDKYGWDNYKETMYGPEIRRLLQRLGTEAGRETLWDSIWIDAALKDVTSRDKVVVTDARFFNEFDAIRDRGGIIVRIEREGVGPVNDHASEMEAISYPHFEATLFNDGSLEDWKRFCKYWFDPRRL